MNEESAHDKTLREIGLIRDNPFAVVVRRVLQQEKNERLPMQTVSAIQNDHANLFSVTQYNILAAYIGYNYMPWFLHGVKDEAMRKKIDQYFSDFNKTHKKQVCGKSKLCGGGAGNTCNCEWTDIFELVGLAGFLKDENGVDVFPSLEQESKNFIWQERKEKIIKTLKTLGSDILSLVEFDPGKDDVNLNYFKENLPDYAIEFHLRKGKQDGNAVLYKKDTFSLVDKLNVDYSDYNEQNKSDRSALFVLLKHLKSGNLIVVISTHLMRDPENEALTPIRVHQAQEMNAALNTWLSKHNVTDACTGIVLAGDLNAIPSSIVLKNLESYGFQSTLSNCSLAKNADGKQKYCTSKTAGRSVWIDYIFYKNLTVANAFDCEMQSILYNDPFNIRNSEIPSDHTPIKVKFAFSKQCANSA